ncbi:hypothetical protein Nepgr_017896 [Nepenthes gracilis]|uniref:Uncharacterized protein n=1 Tax=Nepenthes gracilis TaxID=150966 RepID=A0AAD3SQ91_NEPGR|nr:hypothetical protein Nepgr_017896 [Nepenthes gracilis]
MSKVHPQAAPLSSPTQPPCLSSKPQVFTIWMKSLIMGGRGCTVFDSTGQIVYRVDNYNIKHSNKVYLMDSRGKVLCTLLRKKYRVLCPHWEGYRTLDAELNKGNKPWFRVQKAWRIFRKVLSFEVIVNWDHVKQSMLTIESTKTGSACRIVDGLGFLVADIKRKQSACGVALGDDVLTLTVEANVDQCLIMGILVAYSLLGCKM